MKASSALNKIVSWLGLFFFVLAAYMIYRQLSKYSMEELKNALLSIPLDNLLYALCASFTGYVALSTYDYLALKYIQRKLAAWKWILTGFVGFSISNNAGHAIVSGGTDNHSMLVDLRSKYPDLTGKVAEKALVSADITVNKNMVPFDSRSPFQTSGIRVGTPAVTSRGLVEKDMPVIVEMIDKVLSNVDKPEVIEEVKAQARQLMSGRPLNIW